MPRPIAIVLGTRPEIIKLAPIIREAKARQLPCIVIHTNQHYSAELDAIFFRDLQLNPPDYNLHVGAGTQTEQTARMMTGIEAVLLETKPACLIVQGDTNSVLAGALVASKLQVPIAHVEAGLRSYDRAMPEEVNRIITDHISSLLLPPTEACAETLKAEGSEEGKVLVTGNTVVDSVLQNKELAAGIDLAPFGVERGKYYLLTLHRPSNVDSMEDLEAIMAALGETGERTGTPFLFPAHPRTKGAIEKFGLRLPDSIRLIEPVGYFEMLALQQGAAAIFTDSGGIQEEACILGVPCLTLRTTTERPETVEVGANLLVERTAESMLAALAHFEHTNTWANPFGDGTASAKILDRLTAEYLAVKGE